MEKRGILLHVEGRGHAETAPPGDPPDVVPHHIDDHRVLGAVFLGIGQCGPQQAVAGKRHAAADGAFHRARGQAIAVEAEEQLRRGGADDVVSGLDVRAVAGPLCAAQTREEGPRIAGKRRPQAIGVVHLIGFPAGDVVLDAFDGPLVLAGGNGGPPLAGESFSGRKAGDILARDHPAEEAEPGQGERAGRMHGTGVVHRRRRLVGQEAGGTEPLFGGPLGRRQDCEDFLDPPGFEDLDQVFAAQPAWAVAVRLPVEYDACHSQRNRS